MVWWIRQATAARMEPSPSGTLHTRKHSSHWYVAKKKDFAFFFSFSFSGVSEQPQVRKKYPMNKDDSLKEHKLYHIFKRTRLIYTKINQSNLLWRLWWFLSVLYYFLRLKVRKGRGEEGGKEGSMKLTSQRPTCIPFDQTTPKQGVWPLGKRLYCYIQIITLESLAIRINPFIYGIQWELGA